LRQARLGHIDGDGSGGGSDPLPAEAPDRYHSSPLALVAAVLLIIAFLVSTLFRVAGSYTHYDLRIVAHLIPARDHTHVLALVHPLVHLGDAAFVGIVAVAGMFGLWMLGYRRTWVTLVGFLSWPVELACKAALPQPDGLASQQASVTLSSLVHGSGSKTVGGWLQHTAPAGVRDLAGWAGGLTFNLVSSYPSGTTARATFAVGLLIWFCLRADVPLISDLCAIALLVPLSVVGMAMVLYDWHWPSDVLGGYLLGFALLAICLAMLRRPAPREAVSQGRPEQVQRAQPARPQSPRSRLPWISN
jgi:membrane-associated phospholipid phosphatase